MSCTKGSETKEESRKNLEIEKTKFQKTKTPHCKYNEGYKHMSYFYIIRETHQVIFFNLLNKGHIRVQGITVFSAYLFIYIKGLSPLLSDSNSDMVSTQK